MINEVTAYKCDKCGQAWLTLSSANNHVCSNNRKCEICGNTIEKDFHYTLCRRCKAIKDKNKYLMIEVKRYEKAKKISVEEYENENPNGLYYSNERYYFDIESFLDSIYRGGEDVPDYVWGTYKEPIQLDADAIVELLQDNDVAYEGYEVSSKAKKDIQDFVEQFNSEHTEYSHWPDYETAILVSDELKTKYKNDRGIEK